jgi:hypothetical protein
MRFSDLIYRELTYAYLSGHESLWSPIKLFQQVDLAASLGHPLEGSLRLDPIRQLEPHAGMGGLLSTRAR